MAKTKTPDRNLQRGVRGRKASGMLPLTENFVERLPEPRVKAHSFTPRGAKQGQYAHQIETAEMIFGIGPAGTGKTYVACNLAAQGFLAGRYKQIIITRPIRESGEKLGFLPGEAEDKFAPYFRRPRFLLEQALGAGHVEYLIKAKKIEFYPLAFMRGESFEDTVCLLDEAQNTTPDQMKLFLTRKGEGSTMIIDGDNTQVDLMPHEKSGLIDGLRKLRGLEDVMITRFGTEDIVRSGMVQKIVARYAVENAPFQRELDEVLGFYQEAIAAPDTYQGAAI